MEYTDKSTRARRKRNKVKSRCVMIIIMSFTLLLGGFICYVFSQKGEVAAMKKVPFDTYDNKTEKVPVIVVDAGHGGDDPGAMWGDICEKDINLQIAQKTEQILRKSGYQVKMTRWDDTKVSLAERVDIAEKEKADVFVSIHQNSMEDDEISDGIETYCNETKNKESFPLALSIQNNITEITKAKNRKVDKESDLHVVSKNKMASCLVETGFLSSTSERKLLLDEKYQKKLAQGIAQGIMQYLGNANIEAQDVSEQSKQPNSKETINNEPSPKEKVVYITIDDGPTLRTPELLEILERYDAKVTFFVTAQFLQGEELKQMLQRIHEKGHAIGVHTYSHDYKSIYSSVKNYMADYKKMNDIILDSIGESSGIFRFPVEVIQDTMKRFVKSYFQR